ncbi:MAG: hypothetical protein V8R61_09040 [Enterocloster sp.]
MTKTTILHAGPPVKWENMCGPMKGAVMGGLIYEGLAKDLKEAEELAASGNTATFFSFLPPSQCSWPYGWYYYIFYAGMACGQQNLWK